MSLAAGIPRFSAQDAAALARALWGLEASARPLPSYVDQNFLIEGADGRYVLRIANAAEERDVLDFQNRILERLAGDLASDLASSVPRLVPERSGQEIVTLPGKGGARHLARLVTYLPGTLLADAAPHSTGLLASLGAFLARLDRALESFAHPAMYRHLRWDLEEAAATLRAHAPAIADPARRALVDGVTERLETYLPALAGELRRGVVHNDANDHNVLVDGERVTGLIDFGDVVHSFLASEVAVAAVYAMFGKAEPLPAAAAVAGGYHAVHPLTEPELVALPELICARLACSVAISARDSGKYPGNDYISVSEADAWRLLDTLVHTSRGRVHDVFFRACPMPATPVLGPSEILERRRRFVAPSLSLSYRRPLTIVRGFMQYLYDDAGRAYLDGVNNVCHVGHGHPRVVAAAREQMARLNTNTRYLHENLARYAERLAATLPDPLGVCFFVCSGSEANDLALRLARAATGGDDVIVVDGAYHGNLSSLIELSPYKFDGPGGAGPPPHVHTVPMPDTYRGPYRASDAAAGRRYAEHVAAAVDAARDRGRRIAAFFCEPMLGCGGQVPLPDGYLEAAYRHVRAAGGVVVADEVQVGFGRVGTHFWAFETQGVVPDVVTLGKPIGNGHPLAAVITTPEIAAAFDNGMEYFNTFGGNPVSCAVGLAVLDVMADEGLREHARRTGTHLLELLGDLRARHSLVGDVRGRGLFLGVELVRDRGTLEPAAEEAAAVVEAMRDRGILLSTDGPLHNVIKIKPPLVFDREDAVRLAEELDAAMAGL